MGAAARPHLRFRGTLSSGACGGVVGTEAGCRSVALRLVLADAVRTANKVYDAREEVSCCRIVVAREHTNGV